MGAQGERTGDAGIGVAVVDQHAHLGHELRVQRDGCRAGGLVAKGGDAGLAQVEGRLHVRAAEEVGHVLHAVAAPVVAAAHLDRELIVKNRVGRGAVGGHARPDGVAEPAH